MNSIGEVSSGGEFYDDEEMPATERELAEDAPWKQIQKNTFTRWCNEHLKCVNKRLGSLETDLSDGLRLISLLEVLSQKRMDKYNKRPNFRQMKLENVSVALKFLERERIKLVSIDSKAIVDGNLKLILGLIWTLILHYSISMPMWDEDEGQVEKTKATPKQRLLGWIQNKVPQMPITNFNKDWQDGRALGALVDNCAPGLCPDWEDWVPEEAEKNATEAIKLADDWLGVPPVIAPEEITNPNVDEHSVMTYLSQFPKAQLKPGAPLRPRTNAKRARAYGKGVEPHGLKVGAPAPFTVETVGAGNGAVLVYLTDPEGHETELRSTPNNDKLKTFSVVYHPMVPGEYKVTVLFAGQDIHKSPFLVNVDDTPVDSSKVHAKGPGLQNGNIVGKETYFDVFTEGAGIGNVGVNIIEPEGKLRPEISQIDEYVYRVKYTPRSAGNHEIHIDFADHPIPKSPYHVHISLPLNPGAVWVDGPGIQPDGVVLRQKTYFTVHTEKAGEGQLAVKIVGPRGVNEPLNIDDNHDGTYTCQYLPSKPGQYVVSITYASKPVPDSPFRVNVSVPADPSKVKVRGPGIETGNVVGQPTYFEVIATDAGNGDVEAVVYDPDGNPRTVQVDIESRPNNVWRCTYTPREKGTHKIEVKFAGDHVPKSPFRVDIVPASNASACRAYGRGIQPKGVRMREKAEFHVTTKGAGDAELQVHVKGPRGHSEPVTVKRNPQDPDIYDCEYYPLKNGEYTVDVNFGNKPIPKSPFKVAVGKEAGPQKVRAYGPGLHGGKVGHSADFVVETTGSEVGQLGFSIEGPSQARIECDDKGDGSCDVRYFPLEAGEYAVHVLCDDEDIKHSPFMAQIEPDDHKTFPDKVKAYGPGLEENGPVAGRPTEYTIDARSAGRPAPITNSIVTANGEEVPVDVQDNGDGTYTCRYTPRAAQKHTIIPTYDGIAVKNSPFRVLVQEDSHPDRVSVYGPGVKPGLKAEEPTYFTVDCSKAGSGDISIGLKCTPGLTPSQPESDIAFDIIKNDNDTFTVKYTPPVAGKYTIMVLFADVEIPDSPINVQVASNHNARKVRADGPGLEKDGVESGKPTHFTIHTRGAGKAKPDVKFRPKNQHAVAAKPEIIDNGDSTYTVKYTPDGQGPMDVEVTYGGDEIPKSPFHVNVAPELDVGQVRVKGLPEQIEVGRPESFTVETDGAGGKGILDVAMVGPDKRPVPVRVRNSPDESKCTFTPKEEGPHRLDVTYDGEPVPGSPFVVEALKPADAGKVKAYGPGLKHGIVDQPAQFTIDTTEAGNGALGLTVEGPSKSKIECVDNGDGTCSVSYLPLEAGDYKINVLFAEEHIPGSPFKAEIEPAFDSSKVRAKGKGLENGKVGKKSAFVVDASDAGEAPVEVQVVNEDGSKVPGVRVHDNGDGTHDVSFVPNKPGDATVAVKYGGDDIPGTPKKVHITPDIDTSSVKTYGPGVEKSGVLTDVDTSFTVDAKRLAPRGGDHINAKAVMPSGETLPIDVTDNGDGTYEAKYCPFEQGPCEILVDYDGCEVPGSPFPVNVEEGCDASKVKAYGPGLISGTTEEPAKFTVDTRGAGTGGLALEVEGPSDAKVTCTDGKDGTCQVEYLPTEAGQYEVNITYGGDAIPGCPFVVPIKDKVDPTKVVCTGPGLSPGVRKNIPQEFLIDASKAGIAPVEATAKGPRGVRDPINVIDNGDGTHTARYTPTAEGLYQVNVQYAGEDVPHMPQRVRVLPTHDASKVNCSGPGLESTVPASMPVEFMIDAKEAGDGILAVQITNPKREKTVSEVAAPSSKKARKDSSSSSSSDDDDKDGEGKKDPEGYPKKAKIVDNNDGTYNVSYVPDMTGRYTISVKYGGDEVPYSPYRIRATPMGEAGKCVISGDGLGPTVPVGKEAVISVDASKAGPGKVNCSINTPDDGLLDVEVVENKDKTFDVFYTPPKPGPYAINLRFGGENIPDSPFSVKAVDEPEEQQRMIEEDRIEAVDAAPAHAYMNGNGLDALEQALDESDILRGVDFVFEVPQTPGELTSVVRMPSGKTSEPKIIDNGDGTVSISYLPTESGLHEMDILFNKEHIPGSPVQFYVDAIAPGHVTAHGPGLVTGRVNKPANFTIVTKDAGQGGLALAVEGPSKAEIKCVDNKDGTCSVSYVPTAPGEYSIAVKFDDEHIRGSPFTANITDGTKPHSGKVVYGAMSDIALKINETDLSLLTASIISPSGREEDCQLKHMPNGHIGISFTPHEVGEHLVHVKKRGRDVANSPFRIMVGKSEIGDASKVLVYGSGIERARSHELAEFFVDTRQAGYGGLGLSIEGPSKVDIDCHDQKDGVCRVTYTPQEPGNYSINVKFAESHVPGSPFTVRCTGEGTHSESIVRHRKAPSIATVGSSCDLNLKIPNNYWQSASSGTVAVGSSSSAYRQSYSRSEHTSYTKSSVGSLGQQTVMQESRSYGAEDGQGKKASSFVPVFSHRSDFGTFQHTGKLKEANIRDLTATVENPSGEVEKAQIFESGDNTYSIRFIPKEMGVHTVSVKYLDEHVPGSPFQFTVGPLGAGGAGKVTAGGPGLESAQVNIPADFNIWTREAGAGGLSIAVEGPSKAEINFEDRKDGSCGVSYIATEPGDYEVSVKFNDEHIPGSPFPVEVKGVGSAPTSPRMKSDATQVNSYGKGLRRGIIGDNNTFTVDCSLAGSNMLLVGVHGPLTPCEEVYVKHIGNRRYTVTYTAKEPGEYTLIVKWGEEHIPGSPFHVKIS
uniref:filamin-C-like isoform X3 n=1 Tax=Styela clava TaxID=7725 RepID=UPI001939AA3A|nr:filamin-C-like isoform X3 [Styela clava]